MPSSPPNGFLAVARSSASTVTNSSSLQATPVHPSESPEIAQEKEKAGCAAKLTAPSVGPGDGKNSSASAAGKCGGRGGEGWQNLSESEEAGGEGLKVARLSPTVGLDAGDALTPKAKVAQLEGIEGGEREGRDKRAWQRDEGVEGVAQEVVKGKIRHEDGQESKEAPTGAGSQGNDTLREETEETEASILLNDVDALEDDASLNLGEIVPGAVLAEADILVLGLQG